MTWEQFLSTAFVVTESGERVLTDSVSSDQVTQSGWYVSTDDSLYYYYADGSYATDETTLDDGTPTCSDRTAC